MRLIAATALAALFAFPVAAGFRTVPVPVYCTEDYSDITDIHGDLVAAYGPVSNPQGVGITVLENDSDLVLVVLLPDGRMCVVWNGEKPGDPA